MVAAGILQLAGIKRVEESRCKKKQTVKWKENSAQEQEGDVLQPVS